MAKAVFLVLAVCVTGSFAASTGRSAKSAEEQESILKCANGKLTGAQNFVDVFKTIMTSCEQTTKPENFYNCFTENLGVTDEDGTPNLGKMNEFYATIFSKMVIEDIPEFKESLNQCGEQYVLDFNGISEQSAAAENFLRCFTDSAQNYSESIEKVCQLEEQFNGEYYRQKQQGQTSDEE